MPSNTNAIRVYCTDCNRETWRVYKMDAGFGKSSCCSAELKRIPFGSKLRELKLKQIRREMETQS